MGAERDGDLQVRSFPNGYDGQWVNGGYEVLDMFALSEVIPPLAREAVALLDAPLCPVFSGELIMGGRQAALQVSETLAQMIEPARFGVATSFGPVDLGETIVGGLMELVTDEHLDGGLATQEWDERGQPLLSAPLIAGGRLVGVGPVLFRGRDPRHLPLHRFGNLSVRPGEQSLDEMISGIERGIYTETPRTGAFDPARGQFTYQCEAGWMIEDGAITSMVRAPVYSGRLREFWLSCDAIGDASTFGVWSLRGGDPRWDTSVGAPALRFTDVAIGRTS